MASRLIPQGCLAATDVLVLAGGLGTRIRSVLGDTPKLLAPIGGQVCLDLLLDWLRRQGARRVVLALGVGADQVCEYLDQHPAADLDIVRVIEPSPMGTAGAVRFARHALQSDPVIVVNGDTLLNADLCALLERHRAAMTLGTLLCTTVEDASRYGRVLVDEDGYISDFVEKDGTFRGPATVSAGAYVLSGELLDQIASGNAKSIEYDVFHKMPRRTLAAYSARFDFTDIGTPESLAGADQQARQSASKIG